MRKDYLKELSDVDQKYISEANPYGKKSRSSLKRLWVSLGAVCGVLVLTLSLWLFVPINSGVDISAYKSDEYYTLIAKISDFTYKPPKYKNNFQMITSKIGEFFNGMFASKGSNNGTTSSEMESATEDAPFEGEKYEEITDNQIVGVIEGDRIKRSDQFIYYLSGNQLKIYRIAKRDSVEVASLELGDSSYMHFDDAELYLSKDCKTVTVFVPSGFLYATPIDNPNLKTQKTVVLSIDVSVPFTPKIKERTEIDGLYLSSRLVDGNFLVMTNKVYYFNSIDYSNKSSFGPQVSTSEGSEFIPCEDIICPDKLSSLRYTVVVKMSESSCEVLDMSAFLSYGSDVYVSEKNVFAFDNYFDKSEDSNGVVVNTAKLLVAGINYSNEGLSHIGKTTLDGNIKDRYSVSEYEGILRVATSTRVRQYSSGSVWPAFRTNASLYCLSVNDLSVVAKCEEFAPEGEEIKSVVYDGYKAYICTATAKLDPVFAFDLSKLPNMPYTRTKDMPGFSTSLISFGGGKVVGIGVDENNNLKLDIYNNDSGEMTPPEALGDDDHFVDIDISDSFVVDNVYSYVHDYKAYYIDRNRGYIGLPAYIAGEYGFKSTPCYLLFKIDGNKITLVETIEYSGNPNLTRGFVFENHLYVLSAEGIDVVELQ